MGSSRDWTVDGDLVRTLAALLEETGLTEIEYAMGERRIRVSRGTAAAPAVTVAMPAPSAAAAPPPAPVEAPGTVKAPMVGTAYLSPQPDAAPFVKLGDSVRQGQTLLIIEAMKVMNQIPAPRAGRVARILVADGAPVEYGQPLLVLE
ncbi:MAG TPA: acetyl-CoA carboxylase biotin carboxyl carrier protein subunit [Stellaceae bacterium]|jgi:acetyl-CoA carboxylase biotin carboxyl carrier protein|nr:acetyl-CoA carboxylase biotin carboxyl carrier protein subunit [Stellaceae bacterium]